MRIALQPHMEMFSSQKTDLELVCKHNRYANFSEMGAGKSLPHALLSLGVIEDDLCDYVVIITPKVVVGDWYKIFIEQMDCDWKNLVTVYHAPKKVRQFMKFRKIIITTYESVAGDFERFADLFENNRCMIVVDEAHYIKNPTSKRTEYITYLCLLSMRCYLLTGTPMPNGLKDAFSYINILRHKEHYRNQHHFNRTHIVTSPHSKYITIGYRKVEELEKLISSFSVRHRKRDILDLPPVVPINRVIEWDTKQLKYYKQLVEEFIIELEDRFIQADSAGARLARLHQIVTNPAQLGLPCESKRFSVLDEDIESIGPNEHKIVIFAHYRDTMKKLKAQLKDYNPALIYGGIPDFEVQKDKFVNDPTCRIMIAHPKSAGIGVNFTVANYCIFFEYTYDLDCYDQAIARLDRPGQKKTVTVLNYMLRGSMEQRKIMPALSSKKKLSGMMLNDPKEMADLIKVKLEDEFNFAA